jgi:hypothetical protein
LAALHINTIGLTNPFYGAGNVFRTDGDAGNLNRWQLFTGTTEKFRLSVPASSNDVDFKVVSNGILRVYTNDVPRFTINGGTSTSGSGYAAFGNDLTGFTAVDRLHLNHNTNSSVRIRFTNSTTDGTSTDGSSIGIQGNGELRINQFEEKDITFRTRGNLDPTIQIP